MAALSGSEEDTGAARLAEATVAANSQTVSNPIVVENQKTGNPQSEWDLNGPGSDNIEGFTTRISVNHGNQVDFKIDTDSADYRIDIYRLGFYGGMGARRITTIRRNRATVQPAPGGDHSIGLYDAGNWQVSASWIVPSTAVSGVYIAKLVRQDGIAGANHIPFIVRDDGKQHDIAFQTSDTTWHAYNGWGGANFYGGNATASGTGRAFKVSYNRPITTRERGGTDAGPQNFVFSAEYAAIRWLERNGYDVCYISGVDTGPGNARLTDYKVFMSVGHDEYWSGNQRAHVEAARDAGVNLVFISGNEVYWKTRWEPDINQAPNRTLVTYKETWAGNKIDPSPEWTGTWRDPSFSPPSDGERPENGLTGTIFQVDSHRRDILTVPFALSRFRFWRNTSVATISSGQTASLAAGILGYEWDESPDNGFRPGGLIHLSSTTIDVNKYLVDYGRTTAPRRATHNLSLYRAPSGALVFGAGTVFWSFGLDTVHDYSSSGEVIPTPEDPIVQQATVNLFADMGVQPQTLQAGMVPAAASTDVVPPLSTITAPLANVNVVQQQKVTISGTATDTGGRVACTEVSTDGGTTWHPAAGTTSWTYNWWPLLPGTYTIKSRAIDDSLNIEAPGAGIAVTVTPGAIVSLFTAADAPATVRSSDPDPVELGLKFQANTPGTVPGVRFYKNSDNIGTHVAHLWNSTGTLLATATFTGETASGWQTANFAQPVAITVGTTYVASYHTSRFYSATPNYFRTDRTSGVLTAPASGGNGVFAYGAAGTFPAGTYNATNYWVDPIVQTPVTTQTVFGTGDTPATVTVNDTNPVTLGMKFRTSVDGRATGIRFYKGPQNTGTHVAHLWNSTGTLLATATFTGETASGWQTANFAQPVAITVGTTYVASYHSNGFYSANSTYFTTAHTNGSLTAPDSASAGGNGVFIYGAAGTFPTNTYNATNYWVDPIVQTPST